MLFSVSYKSSYKKDAHEIKCPDTKLGYIFNFIKEHPDKRICIVSSSIDLDKVKQQVDMVKEIVQDYTIECRNLKELITLLNEGYNAFLAYPVVDWETFSLLKQIKVSDIYIDGPLGFQQEKLSIGKEHLKLRASPTRSPNASLIGASPQSFFIRPEDLKLYSSIDVIDFQETETKKEDTLFRIYTRGSFDHDLNILIPQSGMDVNNLLVQKDFGSTRLNCRQRCKIPGYSCHYCLRTPQIIKKLVKVAKKEN